MHQSRFVDSVSYINERSGTFATEGGLPLAQAELNDVPLLRESDIVIVRAGLQEATKGQHLTSDEFGDRVERAKGDDQFIVAWMGTDDAKNRLSRIVTAPWVPRCNYHATSRSKTNKYADGTGENEACHLCP
eukprot:3864552-Pleurochrysis_carterae.AAC.1